MKRIGIFLLSCVAGFAQTSSVEGMLSIYSTDTMKQLFGNKVPLYEGVVTAKNYGSATVQLTPADLYLSLPTINTMTAADATLILTKAFSTSKLQRTVQIINAAVGGVALSAGAGGLAANLSVRTLGLITGGTMLGQQVVLPIFTNGQPTLPQLITSQCDAQDFTLSAGQSFSCRLYIQKPPKGTALPSVVTFALTTTGPVPNAPPAPPPLMLRPQHEASVDLDFEDDDLATREIRLAKIMAARELVAQMQTEAR